MGVEGKIRRTLLEMDKLEAVIGLGPNLFYGTRLAACTRCSRPGKSRNAGTGSLIVDASAVFKKGRNQNALLPEHVDRIFGWYRAYKNVEGIAKVVALEEISANDWNLNITRYVERVSDQETVTVQEAIGNLKSALADAYAAEDRLKLLEEEGLLK